MKKVLLIICFVAATAYANAQAQNYVTLDLTQPTQPSELVYTDDGGWIETFSNQSLQFQQFTFSHSGNDTPYLYWDGFTVSISGDDTEHDYTFWSQSPAGCMAGGGLPTPLSKSLLDAYGTPGLPYLIATKPMMGEPWEIKFDQPYIPSNIFVANHPYPYYVNINGNDFARALDQDGDFFKLIITGHNDLTGYEHSVEHLLAHFDNGQLQQSQLWENITLDDMQAVNRLSFDMQSSDSDPTWGINTPAYFCLTGLTLLDNQQSNTHIDQTNVFPNPFTNTLNVTGINVHYVNLFATNGTLVKQVTGNNANTLQLNTSNWQQGNYIIQVNDDNGIHVHKVVKK